MNTSNTIIKTLYSEGFSSLMMSYYKYILVLTFNPYIGKNNVGFPQYNIKTFLSTSVNYEEAALFYLTAMSILEGKNADKEISAVLTRNNATLTFEYKPDQNNQMTAYLVINKNNQIIPFRFNTKTYQAQENGQMITKVVQAGLGVFAKTLESYMTGTGITNHLNKSIEEELENPQSPSQTGNNSQY